MTHRCDPDMRPVTNVVRRGAVYYFRRRVPENLQPIIGKALIRESLDTRELPKARRLTNWKRRDPVARGYGQWLNPLGRWDWWELGGRFDGHVSGQPRRGAGSNSMISSAPNKGRDLLGGVARALGDKALEFEAEIAANVDLVSALLDATRRGDEHAFPTAVVLPVGACADEFRWFDSLGCTTASPPKRRRCPTRFGFLSVLPRRTGCARSSGCKN